MSMRWSTDSPYPRSISCSPSTVNYSIISSIVEDEACPPKLPDSFPYVDEIAKFKAVKKNEFFDIKPSWSGMNIHPTTKDQLDMQILSQRVNHIMEYSIVHARIIGALPKLLENDALLLRKWMKHEDAEFVIRRLNRLNSNMLDDVSKQIKTITGFMVENDLQFAYRLLTTNKCFGLYIEKYPPEMSQYIKVFINALTEFGLLVKRQMEMTAYEVVEKDNRLRLLYEELRERRVEMKRYTDSMNENLLEHETKMKKKEIQISRVKEKIHQTSNSFTELMQNCLRSSDKLLFNSGERSLMAQIELAELAKSAQVTYVSLRDSHLADERMMRTRKTKYEAQLAMWLSKYDSDVGERQTELDEVTDGYEKETEEMQELECLLLEQDKTFARYKAEKEEEDLEIIKGKLFVIAAGRAAKVIQNAWREYLHRKQKRKGRNKKAKGKKHGKK